MSTGSGTATRATRAGSGPQNQRRRPGDLTGVRSQKLAEERDQDRADQLAAEQRVVESEREVLRHTVVDYTQHGVVEELLPDEPVEAHPEHMIIRVSYPIDEMTFGKEVISDAVFDEHGVMTQAPVLGRLQRYDFKEGVQYKVPWELGMHLRRLGYVYDF